MMLVRALEEQTQNENAEASKFPVPASNAGYAGRLPAFMAFAFFFMGWHEALSIQRR